VVRVTGNFQSETALNSLAAQAMHAALENGWADPKKIGQSPSRAANLRNNALESIATNLGVAADQIEISGEVGLGYFLCLGGFLTPQRKLFYGAGDRSGVIATARSHQGDSQIIPLNQKGEWRKCVLELADALNVLPDDLFSERQKVLVLKTSTGSKDVTETELLRIGGQHIWDNRLEDMQDNEGVREIAHEQTEKLLNAAMDEKLTARERKILEARFGLSGEEKTLAEIAKQFDVSTDRIRQLEFKALQKLRTHETGKILRQLSGEG
jgi:RNA polymerase sigma factor (sigma-70 family)